MTPMIATETDQPGSVQRMVSLLTDGIDQHPHADREGVAARGRLASRYQ